MAEWTKEEYTYSLLRALLQTHINHRRGLVSSEKLEKVITFAIETFIEKILKGETND